jgi:hypothetical protein
MLALGRQAPGPLNLRVVKGAVIGIRCKAPGSGCGDSGLAAVVTAAGVAVAARACLAAMDGAAL